MALDECKGRNSVLSISNLPGSEPEQHRPEAFGSSLSGEEVRQPDLQDQGTKARVWPHGEGMLGKGWPEHAPSAAMLEEDGLEGLRGGGGTRGLTG